MNVPSWIVQYLVAALVFCVLDVVWLAVVAQDLYAAQLGPLLAEPVNLPAAVAFYAIFVGGLVYFVIRPALAAGSVRRALLAGALFGLVCYATFDLTSLAVINGFPAVLVPIDLAWGAALSATVSAVTHLTCRALRSAA